MSAFVVHGVSRHRCTEVARKKVDLGIKNERWQLVGRRTEAEWEAAVSAEADRLWNESKPAAISPRYDAPEFAERYMEACRGGADFRDLSIFALVPTGETDPKTKMPVLKWMSWNSHLASKYHKAA